MEYKKQTKMIVPFIFTKSIFGFVVDPFPKGSPLTEIFSTNCLQMTQSQQMLKAYVMVGLNSTFQSPKERLVQAIPVYDKRMHDVRAYFHKKLTSHNDAKKAFDEAMSLWQENKKMLLQTPTKENAVKIKKNFLLMINKLLAGTKPLATPAVGTDIFNWKTLQKTFGDNYRLLDANLGCEYTKL